MSTISIIIALVLTVLIFKKMKKKDEDSGIIRVAKFIVKFITICFFICFFLETINESNNKNVPAVPKKETPVIQNNNSSSKRRNYVELEPTEPKPKPQKPTTYPFSATIVIEQELFKFLRFHVIIGDEKWLLSEKSGAEYQIVTYNPEDIFPEEARSYKFEGEITNIKPIIKVIPELDPATKKMILKNPELSIREVSGHFRVTASSNNKYVAYENNFFHNEVGNLMKRDLSNDGIFGDAITINDDDYTSMD